MDSSIAWYSVSPSVYNSKASEPAVRVGAQLAPHSSAARPSIPQLPWHACDIFSGARLGRWGARLQIALGRLVEFRHTARAAKVVSRILVVTCSRRFFRVHQHPAHRISFHLSTPYKSQPRRNRHRLPPSRTPPMTVIASAWGHSTVSPTPLRKIPLSTSM